MSKIRARKRKLLIKRKQKRRGKLRALRQEYFAMHDKRTREQLLEKILKIAPDFGLELINPKKDKHAAN